MKSTKYIFVTGGVVSGLGKGITAASLGRLMKNRGYKVTIQKIDPYINVDPGTISPYEHGEVFVTEDGAETDLDLGHYERFINENLSKNSSISMGKIYSQVLEKERKGYYQGKTVQVIPHITNEIKEKVYSFEDTDIDIVITEIGGTVGDIEGLSVLEAIRQVGLEKNPEDVVYIHVTLLPYITGSNEIKSKPTQHSVKELQSLGIKPDILVCRTESDIPDSIKEKLALFCNVRKSSVIANKTADNLYAIPLMLEEEGLAREVCTHLRLDKYVPDNLNWEKMIERIRKIEDKKIEVAIVGRYVQLEDSYLSITESLKHAGFANNVNVHVNMVNFEEINKENVKEKLGKYSAIVVADWIENKIGDESIETIKYARENKIPFLAIDEGFQIAIVEFARNVLKIEDANSKQYDEKTKNPIINIVEYPKEIANNNKKMRLGAYKCILKENTLASKIYEGNKEIYERHRHGFEYNNEYKKAFEEKGLICSGISENEEFVEIMELNNHPYYIVTQFHPELKSRPNKPASIFVQLIKNAIK